MLLNLDVHGIDSVRLLLQGVNAVTLGNAIMDKAGPILLNRTRLNFLAEKDPDGHPWVKSKAAEQRASIGRGGGTLFDTGTLFHSIQYAKVGNSRVFGTDVPYAVKHQEGIGTLKRVILGFSAADLALVKLIAEREVARVVAGGTL